ncbi:hypothetical protein ABZU76_38430 [Amycolatopsis sp. NPDC005232]|uniref:hypothetical protein n=1 Tax=Amycolatopsis sp. NPDC005232 TaxID=3157027 RepID=UPI0033A713D1
MIDPTQDADNIELDRRLDNLNHHLIEMFAADLDDPQCVEAFRFGLALRAGTFSTDASAASHRAVAQAGLVHARRAAKGERAKCGRSVLNWLRYWPNAVLVLLTICAVGIVVVLIKGAAVLVILPAVAPLFAAVQVFSRLCRVIAQHKPKRQQRIHVKIEHEDRRTRT